MKVLLDEGYSVTAGVLNVLDTDFETADFLKIPVTTEAPFSPITEKVHNANLDMIRKASTVVLTSVPFGFGNLQNLEAARKALASGVPTYVIEEVPIAQRDFTRGQAKKLFKELKSQGAIFVKNKNELLSLLNVSEEKMNRVKCEKAKLTDHLKPKSVEELK